MSRQDKPNAARKPATIRLTVRLTPDGFAEARQQLDELEEKTRAQAWQELRQLTAEIRSQSQYATEDEATAEATEAVREVRAEMRRERG